MSELTLDSGNVTARREGHVWYVTLDRADKRNALTRAMYVDLGRAIDHAQTDAEVRVVCLAGTGDMFCAGNDIADFAAADPSSGDTRSDGPALRFITKLAACDKATVVAVQGQATGIGTTLLLHADLVIAAEDARFYTAFVDLALVPEAGSSMLLPALVGRQHANRLLLAGDTLTAEEAREMGLVAYVVPRSALADRTRALVERMAEKSPAAIARSKQLMREAMDVGRLRAQIEREAEVFAERLASDEVSAIIQRFLTRRR